jgi:hypothetical protein
MHGEAFIGDEPLHAADKLTQLWLILGSLWAVEREVVGVAPA